MMSTGIKLFDPLNQPQRSLWAPGLSVNAPPQSSRVLLPAIPQWIRLGGPLGKAHEEFLVKSCLEHPLEPGRPPKSSFCQSL